MNRCVWYLDYLKEIPWAGNRSLRARQISGAAGSKTQERTGSSGHGQSPSM